MTLFVNNRFMNLLTASRKDVRQEHRPVPSPSAALVLPFNPKMTPRSDLDLLVQNMQASAERSLLAAHPSGEAMPVIRKLQQLLRSLNFSTHRTGVALFASGDIGKTLYVDFAVEPRMIIDQPFRVRELADCKPAHKEYLLLLLTGTQSKMYRNNVSGLRLVKSNTPQNIYAYLNEVPEKTGNFSEISNRHEVMLNKFMHYMDEGLGAVLKAYPLPVFVAGTERVAGHFGRITRHEKNIAGYVYKHCIDANEQELEEVLHPMLEDWRQLTGRMLLLQIEKAAEAGKLICGIGEVTKVARCSNSRIIIIEEALSQARHGGGFYREDPIDEIVEKVLDNGGAVEKLDKASLSKYGNIALIRYD